MSCCAGFLCCLVALSSVFVRLPRLPVSPRLRLLSSLAVFARRFPLLSGFAGLACRFSLLSRAALRFVRRGLP
jgi:hypothetical protein